MGLFNQDRISNRLHKDGTVNYYRNVLTHNVANRYFDLLLQNIVWENDEVVIFGRKVVVPDPRGGIRHIIPGKGFYS